MDSRWSTSPARVLRPARARGPDLRADIFDQRQVRNRRAQALGHAQGEAPGIDQHRHVGLFAPRQRRGLVRAAHHPGIGHQALDQPEDGQLGDVERALDALRRPSARRRRRRSARPRPAARSARASPAPSVVAGGLGRHQHDASAAGSRPVGVHAETNRPSRRPSRSPRPGPAPAGAPPRRPRRPARRAAARLDGRRADGRQVDARSWMGLGALASTPRRARRGRAGPRAGPPARQHGVGALLRLDRQHHAAADHRPLADVQRADGAGDVQRVGDVGRCSGRAHGGRAARPAAPGRPSPRPRPRPRSLPSRTRRPASAAGRRRPCAPRRSPPARRAGPADRASAWRSRAAPPGRPSRPPCSPRRFSASKQLPNSARPTSAPAIGSRPAPAKPFRRITNSGRPVASAMLGDATGRLAAAGDQAELAHG